MRGDRGLCFNALLQRMVAITEATSYVVDLESTHSFNALRVGSQAKASFVPNSIPIAPALSS